MALASKHTPDIAMIRMTCSIRQKAISLAERIGNQRFSRLQNDWRWAEIHAELAPQGIIPQRAMHTAISASNSPRGCLFIK